MPWRYNPNLTSADYLELARKRCRTLRKSVAAHYSHLDYFSYDDEVADRVVARLMDRANWSDNVIRQNKRPRVFIDARINQSRNLSVRWAEGVNGIFFPEDFDPQMLHGIQEGAWANYRSGGELMWVKGFGDLTFRAGADRECATVEKALLFGYKARLDELISTLARSLDVVGAMTIKFSYMRKRVSDAKLVPTIDLLHLNSLQRQSLEKWKKIYLT